METENRNTENQIAKTRLLPETTASEMEVKIYDLDEMDRKANDIILFYTSAATAACALPIPFADAPILIAGQTAMLSELCKVYEINLQKKGLSSLLYGVMSVGATTLMGKTIFGSFMKLIPGAGPLAGGAFAASTGGVLTAALGKAWCHLCKDVLSGNKELSELTGKKGIKLLSTALKDQLRLEMSKEEKTEDVLKQVNVPSDDQIIEMPAKKEINSDQAHEAKQD